MERRERALLDDALMFSIVGDAKAVPLSSNSIDLVVTSPPYFMQKIYMDGDDVLRGQMGHEQTPFQYLDALVIAASECARVLKPRRSMFFNLGDKYCGYHNGAGKPSAIGDPLRERDATMPDGPPSAPTVWGVRNKSLMALPQRFVVRCMDELGLIFRSEIVWDKTGYVSPEAGVRDRAWKTHEVWLHFSNHDRYYYNRELACMTSSVVRQRTATSPDHPAPFPEEWPKRFIEVHCPPEGVVLDPFVGSGSTLRAATACGVASVGIDLSHQYAANAGDG